jgi:F-type H+-transporting ATPase subunit b
MLSARRSWSACSIGKRRDPVTRTLNALSTQTPATAAARIAVSVFCAFAIVLAAVGVASAGPVVTAPPQPAAAEASAATPAAEQASHQAEPPAAQAADPAHQGEAPATEVHGKEAGKDDGEHGEGEQAESPWALVARLFNFAILAGGLFYLLRSPLAGFLEQRGITVRRELTKAADLKKEASAQVAQIDAKMAALPAEIEALERRGAEEIAAEEARIHALAGSERARLLEQARREIETQLRIAERDLKKRAGELAVAVATDRVKRTITETDHARLVDRYVSQVRH